MRSLLAVPTAVIVLSTTGAVALGPGGDSTQPKGSSVGDGLQATAPKVSSSVRKAARRGGCSVRGFASDGHLHGQPTSFAQTPPTSGTHAPRWADWGIYEDVVPMAYQVHNLEHGGVVVAVGSRTSGAAIERFAEFYAAEPGYLVVTPPASTTLSPAAPGVRAFPSRGLVATSWQRRLVCKKGTKRSVAALRTFIRAYRGAGPEQVPSFNSTAPRPADLPEPSVPMPADA